MMSKSSSSTDLETLERSIANFVIEARPSGRRLGESPFGIVEEVSLLSKHDASLIFNNFYKPLQMFVSTTSYTVEGLYFSA